MLTKPQTTHHWRSWARVVEANAWRESGGCLDPRARERAAASIWHRYVWQVASQLAMAEHRAVTAEDLRHACYAVATTKVPGRRSATVVWSMSQLENWSFSRLLHLWALLVDPDNVTAAAHWEDPSQDLRASYLAGIKANAPDAYIRQIAGDRFGTRSYENLDVGQLRELSLTIRSRKKSWNARVQEEETAVDQPF